MKNRIVKKLHKRNVKAILAGRFPRETDMKTLQSNGKELTDGSTTPQNYTGI